MNIIETERNPNLAWTSTPKFEGTETQQTQTNPNVIVFNRRD